MIQVTKIIVTYSKNKLLPCKPKKNVLVISIFDAKYNTRHKSSHL